MDVAKRNQFIARLSRALGRDQEMCPAFVEGFDYSHGPQETMFQDLSRDQILTMLRNNVNVLVQNSLKLHLTN